MPRIRTGLALVETSLGILAIGGRGRDGNDFPDYLSEVLKLECQNDQIQSCGWEEMEQKLEVGRGFHVSIPLPESYDVCN